MLDTSKQQYIRVLYVEDDPIDQLALTRLMNERNLPYDLLITGSLTQACKLLAEQRFDVILADYLLGSGTAFDLLAHVSDTPVIFMTGQGSEEIAASAFRAGVHDYIVKDHARQYLYRIPELVDSVIQQKHTLIKERSGQEERVRQQVLQQFFADISHDLRTYLSMMGSSLYLLEKDLDQLAGMLHDSPAPLTATLKSITRRKRAIQKQERHLEQIMLNLLKMVKLDATDALMVNCYDLNSLLAERAAAYRLSAEASGLKLWIVQESAHLWVRADAEELTSMLDELAANAVIYTPRGEVTITTRAVHEDVVLEVSDTGIGIAPDDLDKIFQRFYRGDKNRNVENGNFGLGLALVKRIVELHHGTIEVESTPGQGSLFRVRLPKTDCS
jgi:signal transduction histidine kinase